MFRALLVVATAVVAYNKSERIRNFVDKVRTESDGIIDKIVDKMA